MDFFLLFLYDSIFFYSWRLLSYYELRYFIYFSFFKVFQLFAPFYILSLSFFILFSFWIYFFFFFLGGNSGFCLDFLCFLPLLFFRYLLIFFIFLYISSYNSLVFVTVKWFTCVFIFLILSFSLFASILLFFIYVRHMRIF